MAPTQPHDCERWDETNTNQHQRRKEKLLPYVTTRPRALPRECLQQSEGLVRHASGRPQRNRQQMLDKQTSPDLKPKSSIRAARRPRGFHLPHFVIPSFLSLHFLLLFSYSLSYLSPVPSLAPSVSLGPSGLVESGTSVPVRGAQWGPVEDTKGGLPQLPVTLRPTQQLFGVYTSVLNPRTQLHHKGTSLAPAQRSPLPARLKQRCNQTHK